MGDLFTNMIEIDKERQVLRDNGIIMLADHVDSVMAKEAIQDILILSSKKTIVYLDNPPPAFDYVPTYPEITIIMNSPGGDVESGLGIIDAIRHAQGMGIRITGKVWGHAMSMMLDILQSCDYRIAGSNAWLMVHGMSGGHGGDIKAGKSHQYFMETLTEQSAMMYADRNTSEDEQYHTKEYWVEIMEDDNPNYIPAELAFSMGLIDEIE